MSETARVAVSAPRVVVDLTTCAPDEHAYEWDDGVKGDVCAKCGIVSHDADTQGLELVGRQKDDGEWIGGRQFLRHGGTALDQHALTMNGRHIKGAIADNRADHARRRLVRFLLPCLSEAMLSSCVMDRSRTRHS